MAERFSGRTAIVTGAGSGIGKATALAFAREGAKVAVADIWEQGGKKTVEMINSAGGEAIFLKVDVSRKDEVKAMILGTVETYGGLDFAFNNAGIDGTGDDASEENWDRVIGINLKGVWLCMKYEISQMRRQGGGIIVNTSSVAGLPGYRMRGGYAYCASKAGIIQLARVAALKHAQDGIRVNAICPGFCETPLVERLAKTMPKLQFEAPVGRLGRPEEIATAVLWLCSEEAAFITGHALVMDGGAGL